MRDLENVSVVYFVQAGEGGPVKIGTTTSLAARLASMQTGNHEVLRVLGIIRDDHRHERRRHDCFSAHHRGGEWFEPRVDLLAHIETCCEPVTHALARQRSSPSPTPLGIWLDRVGMTQEAFASLSGLSQSLISRYVRGSRRPKSENMLAILRATDGAVSLEDWAELAKRAA